ncbi:hypothetical protein [Idiomarina ramblicola]|uniref:Uncharacterized protein n=1 Tax=Idiomarina ramblicola TaxID=263724 RepID=A0A432Z0I1_9GAMM|nr:hypothetical protein [Idiomarina ramblicola]RUO69696.1 hypothetical protein CWI78_07155 [Idiomarina ramblicola]
MNKKKLTFLSLFIIFSCFSEAEVTETVLYDKALKHASNTVNEPDTGKVTNQSQIEKSLDTVESQLQTVSQEVSSIKSELLANGGYISEEETREIVDNELDELSNRMATLIGHVKNIHSENLRVLTHSSDQAVNSAASSASSSRESLESFVSFVQIVLGFIGLIIGVIAYFIYKARKTVEETHDISSRVISEVNRLNLLKEEIRLLHKLIDLKDAYRQYIEGKGKNNLDVEQKKRHLNNLSGSLIHGYKDMKSLWEKQDSSEDKTEFLDELTENLSYCCSVKGVIKYNEGDKRGAADCFELAYINNRYNFRDRIHNYGCAKAFTYTQFRNKDDLGKVVDCYVELAQFAGAREHFLKDDDLDGLKSEIDCELKKREQEMLVVAV